MPARPPGGKRGALPTLPSARSTLPSSRLRISRTTARPHGGAGRSTKRSATAKGHSPRTRPKATHAEPHASRSRCAWDYEGKGSFAVLRRLVRQRRATARRRRRSARTCTSAPDEGARRDDAGRARGRRRDVRRASTELAKRVGNRDVQMLSLSGKGRVSSARPDRQGSRAPRRGERLGALRRHRAPTGRPRATASRSAPARTSATTAAPAEWTEAANRWCDTLDVTGFPGACRVHRAEAMRLRGRLRQRRRRKRSTACEELEDFDQMIPAAGCVRNRRDRRRRGDLAGAEDAYRISSRARTRAPARALARPARRGQGRRRARRCQRCARGGAGTAVRLRRLPAQVEIAIAAAT